MLKFYKILLQLHVFLLFLLISSILLPPIYIHFYFFPLFSSSFFFRFFLILSIFHSFCPFSFYSRLGSVLYHAYATGLNEVYKRTRWGFKFVANASSESGSLKFLIFPIKLWISKLILINFERKMCTNFLFFAFDIEIINNFNF